MGNTSYNMDNSSISIAKQMYAQLRGESSSGNLDANLETVFGIRSTSTQVFTEQRFRAVVNLEQFCARWHRRMQRPTEADADAFFSSVIDLLDHNPQLQSPPLIGMTEESSGRNTASLNRLMTNNRLDNTGFWEFHLCSRGEAIYGDGETQHLIRAGSLVLIPPGTGCRYYRNPNVTHWDHYWCLFEPYTHWQPWCTLLQQHQALNVMQLSDADTDHIVTLMQSYIDYRYPNELQWYDLAVTSRIESLLVELCAVQSGQAYGLDSRVQLALNFIQQHYTQPWNVTDLADHCHLSSTRLSVLFKQSLGCSPMVWRDQLRMREACQMLTSTTTAISLIGEQLGYPDPMHFSRRFSDLVGLSPRQYRARRRFITA